MSDAEVAALAKFERDHGAAHHIPPGPRRALLLQQAEIGTQVVVESAPGEPSGYVAVIAPDGFMMTKTGLR